MSEIAKNLDITNFNVVKESEIGYELDMKAPDGEPTGAIFIILGKYSESVQKWSKKLFADYQREENLARKKGKDPQPKSLDEIKDQNIEGACIRVIGWKNIQQDFSQELLKKVLVSNPHWVEQILEESNNIANFTKAL